MLTPAFGLALGRAQRLALVASLNFQYLFIDLAKEYTLKPIVTLFYV